MWKHKRAQIAKTILNKKRNAGGITIPDFKLYYRVIETKTEWYWYKIRDADKWNRVEDPEINPGSYSHLDLNKGGCRAKVEGDERMKLTEVQYMHVWKYHNEASAINVHK
jgi:hypothetical protein